MPGGIISVDAKLVFQIINIILLIFILRRFLFHPVKEFMDKRKESIEKDLRDADSKNIQAEGLKSVYEAKISELEAKKEEVLSQALKNGYSRQKEIINQARDKAAKEMERARKQLDREREETRQQLMEQVTQLSLMAASSIISRNLDEETHKSLINDFINEMDEYDEINIHE